MSAPLIIFNSITFVLVGAAVVAYALSSQRRYETIRRFASWIAAVISALVAIIGTVGFAIFTFLECVFGMHCWEPSSVWQSASMRGSYWRPGNCALGCRFEEISATLPESKHRPARLVRIDA